MSFLDDIPDLLTDALGDDFRDAVLTRDGVPSGDSWNPEPSTPVSFACKAINDEWGAFYRSQGLVRADDRMILILATTLATVPQEGDRIEIEDAMLTVVSGGEGQPAVTSDPAHATWTVRARA